MYRYVCADPHRRIPKVRLQCGSEYATGRYRAVSSVKAKTNATISKAKAKATNRKFEATATCCRSTASARQRTTDESTFTKLSSTRNLCSKDEQSLNCYSMMGSHS